MALRLQSSSQAAPTPYAPFGGNSWRQVRLEDGRLIKVGTTDGGVVKITRYLPDGTVDPRYGAQGSLIVETGSSLDVKIHPLADGGLLFVTTRFQQGMPNTVRDLVVGRVTADGRLDASFGAQGVSLLRGDDNWNPSAITTQADGRILVTGTTAQGLTVFRFLPDGRLDLGFGQQGLAVVAVGAATEGADAVVLQDGRIVVAGSTAASEDIENFDFFLARLNSTGSLDTSFGTNGIGVLQASGFQASLELSVDGAGRFLIMGLSFSDLALARFTANGAVDKRFSEDGLTTSALLPIQKASLQADGSLLLDFIRGVSFRFAEDGTPDLGSDAVQPFLGFLGDLALLDDGRVLAAGTTTVGDDARTQLVRYNTDGRLDPAFGTGGRVMVDATAGFEEASAMAVGADGSIVVAGIGQVSDIQEVFTVTRFTSEGALDRSFGNNGVQLISDLPSRFFYEMGAAHILADGRVLLGALTEDGILVMRLQANGRLDTSFGNAGVFLQAARSGTEVQDIAIDAQGRVLVAGRGGSGLFVLRLLPDGALDTRFGQAGEVTVPIGFAIPELYEVKPLADGRVLVIGQKGGDLVVARLTSSGAFDPTFSGDGLVDVNEDGPQSSDRLTVTETGGGAAIVLASPYPLVITATGAIRGAAFGEAAVDNPKGVELRGTAGADTLRGSSGADTLDGLQGNDRLLGLQGNDELVGGEGTDTAQFLQPRANYSIAVGADGRLTVSSPEGIDRLVDVERLTFTDRSVVFDVGAHQAAGQAALLIGAVLGRAAMLAKQDLMAVVVDLFDQGFDLPTLAGALMRLKIWGGVLTASDSSADRAAYLLQVVRQRPPTAAEIESGARAIDSQVEGQFLADLALSAANQIQVDLVGLKASGLEIGPLPGG